MRIIQQVLGICEAEVFGHHYKVVALFLQGVYNLRIRGEVA